MTAHSNAVLVTGASSGIGAAIARELVVRGFRVFGTVRRVEDEVSLRAAGVTPMRMDVTDQASIARARVDMLRLLDGEPLGGLVNNAGIAAAGPLELLPLVELRRVLEVNLVGVVAVTQAFLPQLKAARGRIVNVSSIAGRTALPFGGPYAASKFALEAISDSLRRELIPLGVAVIVVQPGSIQSNIWKKVEEMNLSRYRGSSYERALTHFRKLAIRAGAAARPPARVAVAVARALTARRPPIRIMVVNSRIGQWVTELLPERWLDRLIARRLAPE